MSAPAISPAVRAFFTALLLAGILPGCVVVQTGVTNPVPGMTTVAIAPFANLSAERSVDGRRFALAYHAELQKIPGFQVIPVGVTERAMIDLGLDLDGPDDALKLAEALGADAVVIGAVTDYNPYYPPRIGLQVSWYAPQPRCFVPGIPTDPELGDAVRVWRFAETRGARDLGESKVLRAQSPDEPKSASAGGPLLVAPQSEESAVIQRTGSVETAVPPAPAPVADASGDSSDPVDPPVTDAVGAAGSVAAMPTAVGPFCDPVTACPPPEMAGSYAFGPFNPRQPIMSYTRLFDGSDADLTALLRDYVLLSGDLRSGGWEAYLHRSEDFIRFTAHRMIVEMLTLHGGESRRRYVWLLHHDRH